MKIQLWFGSGGGIEGPIEAVFLKWEERKPTPPRADRVGRASPVQEAKVRITDSAWLANMGWDPHEQGPYDYTCAELGDDRHVPYDDYRWSRLYPTGSRIKEPVLLVEHAKLTLLDKNNSPFKADCPICDEGVVLVSRNLEERALNRVDHCTNCGQQVMYTDDEIHGEKLIPAWPRGVPKTITFQELMALTQGGLSRYDRDEPV